MTIFESYRFQGGMILEGEEVLPRESIMGELAENAGSSLLC